MTTMKIKRILEIEMVLILVLVACTSTRTTPTAPTTVVATSASTADLSLATPYAAQPAAGICASFEGEMVLVTINPDIPDPRCAKVRADQLLTVINNTQNTLQISIGKFSYNLEPAKEVNIDTPFGEYLAPGVHQLQVSPCCGPELWLEESK